MDVTYGVASAQNARPHMEDRSTEMVFPNGWMWFAVYDGHGGHDVADEVAKSLHELFKRHMESGEKVAKGMDRAFTDVDKLVFKNSLQQGSTAAVLLLDPTQCLALTANAGDSEILIGDMKGNSSTLTEVHKPTTKPEAARLRNLRVPVINQRVNGMIMVSRSIGDRSMRPGLIPTPHIKSLKLKSDCFFVVASDGVWDVISKEDLASHVRDLLKAGASEQSIAQSLVKLPGILDNATAIVVKCILHKQ